MNTSPPTRLPWPDLARGVSVVLVVMHHVIRQMVEQAPITWQPAATAWTAVDDFLTPIRIPLFFFISGMLVSRAVRGSFWADRRAWSVPAYLYVLWSILLTLRLLAPGADSDHSFLGNLLGNVALAGSGYWYLYALPLYFVYAYATRRAPGWLAAIPLVIGLLVRGPVTEWTQHAGYAVMDSASLLGSVAANGIFFWIGARYGRTLAEFLTARRTWIGWAALITYAAVQGAAMLTSAESLVAPLTSALGICLGVMLTARASERSRLASGIRYIGARTLPVYVAQFFFVSALSFAWTRLANAPVLAALAPVSWAYPIAVTGVAVGISLLGYSLATRTAALRWLFVPPAAVSGKRENRPTSAR